MKLLLILLTLNLNLMSLIFTEDENIHEIYFGGGCFWCVEAVFEDVKGVLNVVSGYSGGSSKDAMYSMVSSGKTKHAEVCKITYDKSKIKLNQLLEIFFLTHDPTTLNRQGHDIGHHYRSIIFFNDSSENEIIKKYIVKLNKKLFDNSIVTEVKKFEAFYIAEDYHQDYYKLNTKQPYCNAVISPKLIKARNELNKFY